MLGERSIWQPRDRAGLRVADWYIVDLAGLSSLGDSIKTGFSILLPMRDPSFEDDP